MKTLTFLITAVLGVTSCFSQQQGQIPKKEIPIIKDRLDSSGNSNSVNVIILEDQDYPANIAPKSSKTSSLKNSDSSKFHFATSNEGIGQLDWTTFSGRYDIDIDLGEGNAYNGLMSFRMHRDSLFWFSITASIGFQIAKGIIRNDTLHALDLLNKNYYRISLKELQISTQLPAELGALQRLFTGEVLTQEIMYDPTANSGTGVSNFYPGYSFKCNADKTLSENTLIDKVNNRNLNAKYEARLAAKTPERAIASKTRIILKDALKTIQLDVRLKNSSFEGIPSYPFNVPNGYTLVESW